VSDNELINRAVKNALNDYYTKKGEAPVRTEETRHVRTDEYIVPDELGVTGLTVTVSKR
jgi:hypothetical protein